MSESSVLSSDSIFIHQLAELNICGGNRCGKKWMPLASISFHEANKDFKSFTQRKELHQWIFFEHDQQPVLLFSLSLSEPGAFFYRSRQPAFWYSTPANYRADFKDLLIYSCTNPPFPSSQTAMMLCRDCFHSIVLCHLLYLCTVISFYFLVACIQHFWDQSMRKSTKLRTDQWLHSVFYIVTW